MKPGCDFGDVGVDLIVAEGRVYAAAKRVGDEGFNLAAPREYAGGDVVPRDQFLHEDGLIIDRVQPPLGINSVEENDAAVAAPAQRLGDQRIFEASRRDVLRENSPRPEEGASLDNGGEALRTAGRRSLVVEKIELLKARQWKAWRRDQVLAGDDGAGRRRIAWHNHGDSELDKAVDFKREGLVAAAMDDAGAEEKPPAVA